MKWKNLISAIIKVESSGNPNAVGDSGLAVGILQAHPDVLLDVNRVYGTTFDNEDRLNINTSMAIFVLYVLIYATEERLGRKPTEKDYALCWHYGPSFNKIDDRHKYWDKVCSNLK